MIDKRKNILCYVLLIFIEIKLLGAQQVPNTSNNEGNSPTSLQPRFSDLGGMGFPNFGSGRFGNPTSNYPTNSFFPFGNQNNNRQRPQQSGFDFNPNQGNYQNRPIQGYPDQQGYQNQPSYPYQGDMNPGSNYQQFPNQNRPIEGGYPNQNSFPYQGDSNNRYPGYQRPSYSKRPGEGSVMYPDDISRPYQNGGMSSNPNGNFNRPGSGNSFPYPQENQYLSQGNFQGNANDQNFRPGQTNNNFRPDDLSNLPNTNLQLPNGAYQYQPNQYYAPANQNYGPNNFQPFPPNNNVNSNTQYPTSNPGGFNPNPGTMQYPIAGSTGNPNFNTNVQYPMNNIGGTNVNPGMVQYPNSGGSGNPGNFNNTPPNQKLSTNNPNNNDTAAILGKPVIVPPTTSPGQDVLDNSTAVATQKKCVQDCPSTSEYDPICGTNNVTYMNPGRFDCAKKCGLRGTNVNPGMVQYPNSGGSGNPGNFNNTPPNQKLSTNNPNNNDTAAILGKPVIVPPTTSPGQDVLDNSTAVATQKKCVQDCPSTSEYDPICGTNNVTYMNPGRFDCAKKCGLNVSLYKRGRCASDSLSNTLEQ
uniref:Kazal-like domain-containing protein n=1 Tax=Heliothis virescens TaxID=7102 RepID=A0A2A4K104_HELVI